jgi:transposase-like protein
MGGWYPCEHPLEEQKITDDQGELLACCDYPAGHWVHLRTANPVELAVATVRHRTKVTNGPGSGAAGLAMSFKLIEAAQDHWRMASAPHLVALDRAGARSGRGVLTGRPEPAAA